MDVSTTNCGIAGFVPCPMFFLMALQTIGQAMSIIFCDQPRNKKNKRQSNPSTACACLSDRPVHCMDLAGVVGLLAFGYLTLQAK